MLLKVEEIARSIRRGETTSVAVVEAHLRRIAEVNPTLNAAVEVLTESALIRAREADSALQRGELWGPLHGVPFSIKDSIAVAGTRCTAGSLGFRHAPLEHEDATVVARLRAAGGIPIAKTNLPDLLFSFETDNLVFGRTNNPYDLTRTPGGSSGGEAALIAAGGSPLGLGSDCAGSVRLPAAFCGIAGIKPTSGRLPRTGHVPPFGGWIEKLWQIGPMARFVDDVILAIGLLAGEDGRDWTSPPVPLIPPQEPKRIAFFLNNGIAKASPDVEDAVMQCALFLANNGAIVEEETPPGLGDCYELELAILGADGAEGIDAYLREIGSESAHPLLKAFVDRTRPYRASAADFSKRWAQWDRYQAGLMQFFSRYDALLSPVYTQPALLHGTSVSDGNFEGFSYTMAWNVAGFPAATVRCGSSNGLPINVQVITGPWREMTALHVCRQIEKQFGGWRPSGLALQL